MYIYNNKNHFCIVWDIFLWREGAKSHFPSHASLLWPSRYYLPLLKPDWPKILQFLASCHLMSLGFSFWSSICVIEGGDFH